MRKNDWVRLRHMLDAAREAVSLAGRESQASVGKSRTIALALVKLVEIIGEAATSVANERRRNLPQISWANIIGMRNRLIHAYYDINLDILWKTVTEDLPPLIAELEKIVPPPDKP